MIVSKPLISVQSIVGAIEPIWGENFKYKKDRHNFWELVFVIEGQAGILKGDKIYELSPGELIFHSPMEFHNIWAKNNQKLHLIVINFSAVGEVLSTIEHDIIKLSSQDESLLRNVVDYVCDFSESENLIKSQLAFNSLEKLLLMLVSKQKNYFPIQMPNDSSYKKIIHIMRENVNKRLSVKKIALLCNMSQSNLKKIFRQYSGMGVMEYFNQLKTTEAIKLLGEEYSIAQISEKLGYSSPAYFCDSFKRQCDISPTEYRKRFKSTQSYKKQIK